MKKIHAILIGITLASQALGDENKKVSQDWMDLSVCVQNVAKEFETLRELGAPDPSQFEDDLKVINKALNNLVKSGELTERRIDLLPLQKLGDEGMEFLFDYAKALSEKYGYYVAVEMFDIGLEKRLSVFQPMEPFTLHLRLPEEHLNDFLTKVGKKGYLHKPEKAEKGDAEQPATVPELKSEGGDKSRPEAEGRSR